MPSRPILDTGRPGRSVFGNLSHYVYLLILKVPEGRSLLRAANPVLAPLPPTALPAASKKYARAVS
jgi:hypothetical protein